MSARVRVELPAHLCLLANLPHEISVQVAGSVTQRTVLDALEAAHPALIGTIRDHTSKRRRPFMRFFACGLDLSHQTPDDALPEAVAQGDEPLLVIGAVAGGLEP